MGIKDWLAKNVAGVSTYGEVMGRECVKSGIALGRVFYLGHGTRSGSLQQFAFRDSEEMESNGLTLYCKDSLNRPALEDSSELSKQTRAAGIAFAVQVCLMASTNFMQNDTNRRDFHRSLGAGTKGELLTLGSDVGMERVLHFVNLPPAAGVSKALNMEEPGTGDLLGNYLEGLSGQGSNGKVGFQREGVLGFGVVVVPLAQETVVKIREACVKFKW